MRPRAKRALGIVVALSLPAVFSATARADPERAATRRLWLEVRPYTCARELPGFEANVALACDALGQCGVARAESEATERATLLCDPDGHGLSSAALAEIGEREGLFVDLRGDHEQRLRAAAMWIARTNLEGDSIVEAVPPIEPFAKPPAVVPAAPPRSLHEDPYADAAEVERAEKRARRRAKGAAMLQSRTGLSLSAFTGVTNGPGTTEGTAGLRAQLALPLRAGHAGFYWGPAVTYLDFFNAGWPVPGAWGNSTGGGLLAGATIGWGAPFDNLVVGWAFEAGGGTQWGEGPWKGVAATAYGRNALTLQLPVARVPIRPTVGVAGLVLFNQLGLTNETIVLETGFTWQAL
jgi:hypothetical protein